MNNPTLPVAVIGAGPVGLAAAAHLVQTGQTPLILEAGDAVGASVRHWRHVRFFSPWRYSVDTAARALLERHGWTAPTAEDYPTGQDLIDDYLAPLAALPEIAPHIRLHSRVVSVTRQGFDKMKTVGREDAPFIAQIRRSDGGEERVLARAVIDASGTWTAPNPLGASGVPAVGEAELADRIFYGIPDVLGTHRARYAGRRVTVVGSGHSAFNVIVDLAELARQEPATEITWVVRRPTLAQVFGGGEADALVERGALGQRVTELVTAGRLRVVTGFKVAEVTRSQRGIVVGGEQGDNEAMPPVDEIIATTGFRPDLSLLQELRLDLDPAVDCPAALAPLIDPNVHSCGTAPPHGAVELAHPERDVYIVGMKSYGRAPTFLLLTGYEQVRSVVAALAGDWEAARDVRLELPETGVCSSNQEDGSCCSPEPVDRQRGIPVTVLGASNAPTPTTTSGGADKGARRASRLAPLISLDTDQRQRREPILVGAAQPRLESDGRQMAPVTPEAETTCCSASEQETCCDVSEKTLCCGTAGPGSCGCRE